MEVQEQTKKKDLQQTQKLSARAVEKRVLVRDRETVNGGEISDEERGGVKEKRTREDSAR